MTELEWLASSDPQPMLEVLRGKVSDRKLRLFAVACCRRISVMLVDERSQHAIEVAESFADGHSSNQDRTAAFEDAEDAVSAVTSQGERLYFAAVAAGELVEDEFCDEFCGWYGALQLASVPTLEQRVQSELLRDIVGNPFRPVRTDPAWLTLTVKQLAETIYDNRAFVRLSILADALEDAGCSSLDLLNHCRQPGVHVRGCWCLDLLLGKE